MLHATGRGETRNTGARAHIHAHGGGSRGRRSGRGGGRETGMIARSDYVFTRNGGRNGRENSLGSAVPRTAVRLFELCMDTGCLQRVLFALPRSTTILEASPRARMTWKHTTRSSHGRRFELEFKFGHLARSRSSPTRRCLRYA